MFVPSFFHWYARGGVPVALTVTAPVWPGLRLIAAGWVAIAGGLMGVSPVMPVRVSVTGLAVVLRNMKPTSLKTNVAAGASGLENVVVLMPGPLTQMPAPVVFELVLPNDILPLRPWRWNWIVYILPSLSEPAVRA